MKKLALSNLLALTLALGAVVLTHLPAQAADAPQVSITGTIVSIKGDDFVLRTDKGDLKFDMNHKTDKPATLAVGNRITVFYDSDDKLTHEMDARRIVMAPEPAPVSSVTPAPTPEATPPPQQTAPVEQPEPTPTPSTTQTQTELPRTASPLPLAFGAGILALAAALLLRKRASQA